jgi:hypothetical protein
MGLRGAYRKFVKMNRDDVLKSILKDPKSKYSHYSVGPPSIKVDSSMENTPSTQVSNTNNNLSP